MILKDKLKPYLEKSIGIIQSLIPISYRYTELYPQASRCMIRFLATLRLNLNELNFNITHYLFD